MKIKKKSSDLFQGSCSVKEGFTRHNNNQLS